MATKKKVASKKTQKAVPAKKKAVVAKKATTTRKAAAKPAPAKKAAPVAKKATVKKAAPPKLAKPAATKAVAKKAAVPKAAASKKAVVAKTPAVTKASVPPAKTTTTAKKAVEPVKAPAAKKVPAEKQKVVSKSMAATEKVEKLISKPEEKEVIMPVKKSDKEKETGKKAAAEKAAKVEKVEKAEKIEKAEKPAAAAKVEKTEKPGTNRNVKAATTLVSYQPEFTKSVLDQPDAPTGPVYRYSDADLQEFRELINKKLEAAKKELVYLQGLITRKDEAGTDDTENKYMSMEDGSGSQEREQLNQMASRQIQFIDHLEKALVRIENKTYGICRVTGKLIDKARLRAVPHATLSIEAKLAKSK
jgi:DnaK suppressor protein